MSASTSHGWGRGTILGPAYTSASLSPGTDAESRQKQKTDSKQTGNNSNTKNLAASESPQKFLAEVSLRALVRGHTGLSGSRQGLADTRQASWKP